MGLCQDDLLILRPRTARGIVPMGIPHLNIEVCETLGPLHRCLDHYIVFLLLNLSQFLRETIVDKRGAIFDPSEHISQLTRVILIHLRETRVEIIHVYHFSIALQLL